MLPRHHLYYTFRTPLFLFAAFVAGYVLGRMRISFTVSLYKLVVLLIMLFLFQIIMCEVGKKYFKRKNRNKRRMGRAPQEYYDRILGSDPY